jgi:hypothetical protein
MSYEGSVEYLCQDGHRSVVDCWEDRLVKCRCGAAMAYRHSIDHTNGVEDDNPATMPAPTEEIGFTDIWREDHYGNRYAIKDVKYRAGEHWLPVHR